MKVIRRGHFGRQAVLFVVANALLDGVAGKVMAQVAFDQTAVTNVAGQLSAGATAAGGIWVVIAIGFAAVTLGFGIFKWGKRRAGIGG